MTSLSPARARQTDALLGEGMLTVTVDRNRWLIWLAPLLSLAMFSAAVWQLRSLDLHAMLTIAPSAVGFWIALAAAYLAPPVSEWFIYRRLWRLPVAGLAPLLRKYVSNEILLGYSGELYFYAWARARLRFAGAPFGAVKDVSVLSAQAGNLATLAMLLAAWPWLGLLHLDGEERNLLLSCIVAMAVSFPIFLFRHKLFALPKDELRRILLIHLMRIGAALLFSAMAWHAALPVMGLGLWLMLAALRQLLSRLPLLPNKDFMFAALVVFMLGAHSPAADIITLSATLVLVAHLLLASALAAGELLFKPVRT